MAIVKPATSLCALLRSTGKRRWKIRSSSRVASKLPPITSSATITMDVPLSNGGKWLMLKEIGYFYALKVATNNTYIYNKSTLHVVTYVVYTCSLMYLDRCSIRVRGKIYSRILLRESYRHQGKVKHRTVANLSNCST